MRMFMQENKCTYRLPIVTRITLWEWKLETVSQTSKTSPPVL